MRTFEDSNTIFAFLFYEGLSGKFQTGSFIVEGEDYEISPGQLTMNDLPSPGNFGISI